MQIYITEDCLSGNSDGMQSFRDEKHYLIDRIFKRVEILQPYHSIGMYTLVMIFSTFLLSFS